MYYFQCFEPTVDPRNPNLFAVAGLDKYTRLYDIRKSKRDGSTDFGKPVDHYHPLHLIGVHLVGVTGLAFSYQSELLVSYSEISICLFKQNMGLGHDPVLSSPYYAHSEANKKGEELVRVMKADKRSVNSIVSHPQTGVLVSCGTEEIKIWTLEAIDKVVLPTQTELDQQDIVLRLDISRRLEIDQDHVHGARFNADGNLLVYGGLSDKQIKIRDWEAGIAELTFESGHVYISHYFVAKFMPNSDDRSLITCAAVGQDRDRMVAKHIAGANGFAFEPGSLWYRWTGESLIVVEVFRDLELCVRTLQLALQIANL
ncbi:hypothetical protein V6N13_063820 [Hibiscus sabdariffa]